MEGYSLAEKVQYVISGDHPRSRKFNKGQFFGELKSGGWKENMLMSEYSHWEKTFHDRKSGTRVSLRIHVRHWADDDFSTMYIDGDGGYAEGRYSMKMHPVNEKNASNLVDYVKSLGLNPNVVEHDKECMDMKLDNLANPYSIDGLDVANELGVKLLKHMSGFS